MHTCASVILAARVICHEVSPTRRFDKQNPELTRVRDPLLLYHVVIADDTIFHITYAYVVTDCLFLEICHGKVSKKLHLTSERQ